MTVAARLTGILLNELVRLFTCSLGLKSLVVPTLKLDIVLIGFLERSYHITSMTFIVMKHT